MFPTLWIVMITHAGLSLHGMMRVIDLYSLTD